MHYNLKIKKKHNKSAIAIKHVIKVRVIKAFGAGRLMALESGLSLGFLSLSFLLSF